MQQQDNREYPFLYQRQTCHQVQPNQDRKSGSAGMPRSEERFSRNAETDLVCRLLLEKKKLMAPGEAQQALDNFLAAQSALMNQVEMALALGIRIGVLEQLGKAHH